MAVSCADPAQSLHTPTPKSSAFLAGRDLVCWNSKSRIKISDIWEDIHPQAQVLWYRILWLLDNITRVSFIFWLTIPNQLSTISLQSYLVQLLWVS